MIAHYWVDTNVLLRFLSGTPEDQAHAAARLFQKAAAGEALLEVPLLIVAETYYTLLSFYGVARKEAVEKLLALLQSRGVRLPERSAVLGTLNRLRTTNVGFADAYLATLGAEEQLPVASFDRDLDKFKDVRRVEPTV